MTELLNIHIILNIHEECYEKGFFLSCPYIVVESDVALSTWEYKQVLTQKLPDIVRPTL